jgi:hypothetical protein
MMGTDKIDLVSSTPLSGVRQQIGIIHSIAEDEEKNLYLSDEINHLIVSLDPDGKLRWQTGGEGSGIGQFWYPCGIELGWVASEGRNARCLAVADAWNRRVQFLDPDGTTMGEWRAAGDSRFSEITDIRFIAADLDTDQNAGLWLILDRGNHRVCGFSSIGQLLFECGRIFPPTLEVKWHPAGLDSPQDALPKGISVEPPRFDPLYYPERIFGKAQEGIFIVEQGGTRLKQLLLGNLLPVLIRELRNEVWVGADSMGMIIWNKESGHFSRFDASDRTWHDNVVEGAPVPSGRSSTDFWTQTSISLRHWVLNTEQNPEKVHAGSPAVTLSNIALEELEIIGQDRKHNGFLKGLYEISETFRAIVDRALDVAAHASPESDLIESIRNDLAAICAEKNHVNAGGEKSLQPLFLPILKYQCIRSAFREQPELELIRNAGESLNRVSDRLVCECSRLLLLHDAILLSRIALENRPGIGNSALSGLLLELEREVLALAGILARNSGLLSSNRRLILLSKADYETAQNRVKSPGALLRRGAYKTEKNQMQSRHLHEVERISVLPPGISSPARPIAMTKTEQGQLLVALHAAERIVLLNDIGRIIDVIGSDFQGEEILRRPWGISVDCKGLIWVSEPEFNRIRIVNLIDRSVETLNAIGTDRFHLPHGLSLQQDGSVLVADTGNHRIVKISELKDRLEVWGSLGTELGKFRHPSFVICNSDSRGSTRWVVDYRNHRIQELGVSGSAMRSIGSCGIGKGQLVLPISMARFDDGILAVSQYSFTSMIKLFDEATGEEIDALPLNYSPYGLLVHGDRLWVSEGEGDHLRVYERH